MTISLAPLPFAPDALEPAISRRTIEAHYNRHHRGYVEKTLKLLEERPIAQTDDLGAVVRAAAGQPRLRPLFQNAAQAWNHDLYWRSLAPGPTSPDGSLLRRIQDDFGDLRALGDALHQRGVGHFASGWVWLTWDGHNLAVEDTDDADTPMTSGRTCLLTIDVWEHAYYLDTENRRSDHLRAVIDGHLDWAAASERFADAIPS